MVSTPIHDISMESTDDATDTRVRNDAKKPHFSSTCSMFVTLLGFSLGMSDIWRFPFLVYRNGGGAFLIPFVTTVVLCGIPLYFMEFSVANFSGKGPYGIWEISPVFRGAFLIPFVITIVLCGIPLYFMEFSIANFSGKGPYGIWEISPVFRGVGVSVVLAFFIYMIGTTVFRSWLAMFLLDAFKSPLPWTHCQNPWNTPTCRDNPFIDLEIKKSLYNTNQSLSTISGTSNISVASNDSAKMTAAEEYWQYKVIGLSSGITDLSPILWKHILVMLALRFVVFLSVFKSIKSIEKVMYVLLFVPLIFQLTIMVQSLTLPGVSEGVYEFFRPDFSKLANMKIWIEAFLMAFYTLAFGWGVILTMGSHANFHDNCFRTSILLPILDCLSATLNGAVCFMVLGNMAHAYGVKVYDVIKAGFSTGVVTYVSALSILPMPQIWVFAFILNAIMMGLDTQIVPIEMFLQVLEEIYPAAFPKYRLHALTIISILLFVFALPTCTGAGGYIFLWFDWYTGVWIGPICALTELIAVGWIYGMDRFSSDVSLMMGKPVPGFFRVLIVFFAPVMVLVIFISACVEYVPPKYGSYIYPTWSRGVGWLLVFFILSPIIIKALLVVHQQTGSLKKRIKKSMTSSMLWGPKDEEARKEYDVGRHLYKDRHIGEMLHFVIYSSQKVKQQK